MTEATDPFKRAEQELVQSGRPKPDRHAVSRCLDDAVVTLAVAFPLTLLFGREPRLDEWAMWMLVIGVGIVSFAIRSHRGRAWWRHDRQQAMQTMNQEARENGALMKPAGEDVLQK
jgi:hypothetical protein